MLATLHSCLFLHMCISVPPIKWCVPMPTLSSSNLSFVLFVRYVKVHPTISCKQCSWTTINVASTFIIKRGIECSEVHCLGTIQYKHDACIYFPAVVHPNISSTHNEVPTAWLSKIIRHTYTDEWKRRQQKSKHKMRTEEHASVSFFLFMCYLSRRTNWQAWTSTVTD